MTYIIGDIGSCHMGKLDKCIEAVNVGKDCGLDAVKFQLGTSKPNIGLPVAYYQEAFEEGARIGIDVFTSVFAPEFYEHTTFPAIYKPKYMKFAYSQCKGGDGDLGDYTRDILSRDFRSRCKSEGIKIIASCDVMTIMKNLDADIRLYCIPEYPVRYKIDFEGIFPNFDGFSDHTLGFNQTLVAVREGAKFIEKHFCLTEDLDINSPPDEMFALSPSNLKEMIKNIRRIDASKR